MEFNFIIFAGMQTNCKLCTLFLVLIKAIDFTKMRDVLFYFCVCIAPILYLGKRLSTNVFYKDLQQSYCHYSIKLPT